MFSNRHSLLHPLLVHLLNLIGWGLFLCVFGLSFYIPKFQFPIALLKTLTESCTNIQGEIGNHDKLETSAHEAACLNVSHEVCQRVQVVGEAQHKQLIYQLHPVLSHTSQWLGKARHRNHYQCLNGDLYNVEHGIVDAANQNIREPQLAYKRSNHKD